MMFEWKNEYGVQIAEIDKQHKRLFNIGARINDLVYAKDEFDHYDEIMTVMNELLDYTEYHFNYEEKLMEEYQYENFETQKFEHFFLLKKIRKMLDADIDRKQGEAVLNLAAFISDWITNHILKEDMKYREFFNNKGVH
jgi:hemerythrin